jgi:hypothetical protein
MKHKKVWFPLVAGLLIAAFTGSCKKDSYTGVLGVCPVVISTYPANNAVSVPLNSAVTATFNEKMDPATIPGSFTLTSSVSVAGTLTYDDANATITFVPSVPLMPNTTYLARIAATVKDPMGNALQQPYVWTFSTGNTSDTAAPYITATSPVHNATLVPLNKVVTTTFSEPMNALTIVSAFTLMEGINPVSGTVTYSGFKAFFTPAAALLPATLYTATMAASAEDLSGNTLINDSSWTFMTGASTAVPPAIDLKSAEDFGILAGVGVSNNAGFSEIHDMNVGISPGVRTSITGFPPAIVVNGAIYASDDSSPAGIAALLTQAKQDLTDAYLAAEGATIPAPATVAGDLGGITLTPGIYKSTSTLMVQSGDLTLDAQGDPNAFWIFQVASDFTTVGGAGGNIILAGGAQAKNIFWQIGSSATIGDYTAFKGNILALTSITMNTNSVAQGRMLARNGSVVMTSTNTITRP